jgi:hypothetical protein
MNIDPCPVCGAESTWRGNVEDGWISCETSGCIIGGTFLNTDDGRAAAIAQWNHLAASARLAGTNQQVQAWLSSHEMNGVMVRYRGGRFVLHASGMVSSKHLGSIASAEDADYGAALSALAAALGETGR